MAKRSLVYCSLLDQQSIVEFLDYETAKIDALIEKQQQLIALLGEKRQAVISHAVTKGLNPDAPMRDSGVEWLGEVPSHWDVVNLNVVTEIGNGSTPDRSTPRYWGEEGDFPWLNSSVVNQAEVHESDQFVTEAAIRECHLPHILPPAVLVGITGQGKTRGMATILRTEATINQHVTYIQPRNERVTVPFIHRFFQMAYDHIRFESEGAGSTKGAITCGQLEKTKISLPPPDEQQRVVQYLGDFATKFADLIQKAEDANKLLRERRTALISAAVTGKIDVRGWQRPSADPKKETEMEVA
ncbi:restriction endonuclease subunit S [Rubripirellula obstinata]|nr:restriction endonuclease subunit S [Rubripirellula obstinata]